MNPQSSTTLATETTKDESNAASLNQSKDSQAGSRLADSDGADTQVQDSAVVTATRTRTTNRASSADEFHLESDISADEMTAIRMAANLLSETAHDIRSPLTTVRESVRLVRDGDLGEVNRDQVDFLSAAMDQCDCIKQMINDMVQFDRLQTGIPRANRSWVSVNMIRNAVEDTLRPWAVPRDIELLWDGITDTPVNVYSDPSMLRRMLVNLVINAMKVTAEGGHVLVRLVPARGGETLRWSVIDEGPGISESDLHKIVQRSVSGTGSSGLGFSICRKLAALCFSSLDIRSRAGKGTEVSFETPVGTPSNLAESWTRWRSSFRQPTKTPRHRGAREVLGTGNPKAQEIDDLINRSRLDPPSLTTQLGIESIQPKVSDRFMAGTVTLGAALPSATSDGFDALLQTHARHFDLVYRIDQRSWVWIFDANLRDVPGRIDAITTAAEAQFDVIRARWSRPQSIMINGRGTTARVSDLLVRETLQASVPEKYVDQNQVRLGTAPLEQSEIAMNRLDQELKRLSARLRAQTEHLKKQAINLRPN